MLFFLYGPDTYRKNKKLKQMVERFIKERDPLRMNVVNFSIGDTDEEGLRQALRAAPFLAAKRMVVLKNFLTGARRKDLHEILHETLPSLGEDKVIIVSEDESKPKKKKDWKNQTVQKVWEFLEKTAQCEEFSELSGARLEKETDALAKAQGLTLQKDAAALLAIMSGGDLGWAEKEMEKMAAYTRHRHFEERSDEESRTDVRSRIRERSFAGAQDDNIGNTITPAHIQLLCTAEGEANIFEFLDALGNRDRKILLRAAEEQLRDTDAFHLIARATSQIRALLALTLAGQAGAQALKLHPFVARKATAQARKWNATELKKALFALMNLEYRAKSGLAADPATQLMALLANLPPS